jgi:signal transduction histidine kinase
MAVRTNSAGKIHALDKWSRDHRERSAPVRAPEPRPQRAVKAALCALTLLTICSAQDVLTLEQASSRTPPDFTAAYESRTVTVRAQIAAPPIWAYGTYYLPLHDSSEHGLILRGDRDQFNAFEPGDWVEARGKIESRAGLPTLVPEAMEKVRQSPPPPPKSLTLAEAASLRYLGLLVETRGTVTNIGENTGGTIVQLSDGGAIVRAFLPRSQTANDLLTRVHLGERVRATGLLTQYAPQAPFNTDFQVMLASPADLRVSGAGMGWIPILVILSLGVVATFLGLWWLRERRMTAQHQAMRTFHTLCEEIIAAPSPAEIAEKLMTVLPSITQATGAWLYIFNRRTKSLHRVSTETDSEPIVVPVDTPSEGDLANGAAVCFRNREQLNIPDVRRSAYLSTRTKQNAPRSAMMVPLSTQGDVLGVLEAGNANGLGFFSIEEQASIQHLANQVATALKLQEQRTIREQLFRSEKLAATGQLISGVANELRAPLEVILHLSLQLAAQVSNEQREPVPERDLRLLANESRRASEIVSRLVSFAHPEDSETHHFDVNALLAGLVQFREPEWKALELRLQNRLAPEPAFVVGAQGQIEQVFLNLLVHAEQSAAEAPSRTVAVSTSILAGRVLVEIGYSLTGDEANADPFVDGRKSGDGALSLGVCRTIVNNHGGSIRFNSRSGLGYFEVELPVVHSEPSADSNIAGQTERTLTVMLVDSEPVPQRQLLGLLSIRGHRVVPAAPEVAADLAQRLRFDAVFWAMRASGSAGGSKWSEFQDRTRASIGAFVLVSDGYDAGLARSIEEGGNYLLGRPVQEAELDRILRRIDAATASPARR